MNMDNPDSSEFLQIVDRLLDTHQKLLEKLAAIQQLVDHHKNHIDPQAIIMANSDQGYLQRYLVHPRYKEMVKGCGGNRTQYTTFWAGTDQPVYIS